MGRAIAICSKNDTAARITNLWREVGRFEPTPSMDKIGYPPHLTFVISEGSCTRQYEDAVHAVFERLAPLNLTFDKLKFFDVSPLVLWAAPASSNILLNLHQAIHDRIDALDCNEHYRLNAWVPHCTLGTQISESNRTEAIAFASRKIEPFDVVFDHVDCISFPPIRIENRLDLSQST